MNKMSIAMSSIPTHARRCRSKLHNLSTRLLFLSPKESLRQLKIKTAKKTGNIDLKETHENKVNDFDDTEGERVFKENYGHWRFGK